MQCLNSIEASSRAKLNFLEQLYRFHKQQGNPRVSVPEINHKPLDLWLLRKEVHKLGGYEAVMQFIFICLRLLKLSTQVTKSKMWADLGRLLGFSGIPGLSTQIKNSYTRVILPYEHFCERVRNNPSISALKSESRLMPDLNRHPASSSMSLMSNRGNSGADTTNSSVSSKAKRDVSEDTTPPSSPLSSTSSPLSEPPDDGDMQIDAFAAFGRAAKADDNGIFNSCLT